MTFLLTLITSLVLIDICCSWSRWNIFVQGGARGGKTIPWQITFEEEPFRDEDFAYLAR
jgi:hypothetical protein